MFRHLYSNAEDSSFSSSKALGSLTTNMLKKRNFKGSQQGEPDQTEQGRVGGLVSNRNSFYNG